MKLLGRLKQTLLSNLVFKDQTLQAWVPKRPNKKRQLAVETFSVFHQILMQWAGVEVAAEEIIGRLYATVVHHPVDHLYRTGEEIILIDPRRRKRNNLVN